MEFVEILKNKSVNSLAQTMRFLLKEKRSECVDSLMEAKQDDSSFDECVMNILKEAVYWYQHGERIHVPMEDEIKEIYRLAHMDFVWLKDALVILACCNEGKSVEREDGKKVESGKEVEKKKIISEKEIIEIWESGDIAKIEELKETLKRAGTSYYVIKRRKEDLRLYFKFHPKNEYEWHKKRYEKDGFVYLLEKEIDLLEKAKGK